MQDVLRNPTSIIIYLLIASIALLSGCSVERGTDHASLYPPRLVTAETIGCIAWDPLEPVPSVVLARGFAQHDEYDQRDWAANAEGARLCARRGFYFGGRDPKEFSNVIQIGVHRWDVECQHAELARANEPAFAIYSRGSDNKFRMQQQAPNVLRTQWRFTFRDNWPLVDHACSGVPRQFVLPPAGQYVTTAQEARLSRFAADDLCRYYQAMHDTGPAGEAAADE